MSKYTMATNSHDLNNGQARFTVFGVGGGGGNAVEHMVQQGVKGVTFVCANTDKQALDRLTADNKLQLGANTNRGLGAGANPEVGREAAEQDEEAIRKLLEDSDMVFITAGMGGGTGTGAAPVVARIAKEMEILTVGVVTTPFKFEGGKRIKAAKAGIDQLSNFVDSIITIPNDKLLKVYGNISMQDAFKKADDVLMHAVQGIAQTISSEGVINIDFNDIRTAMTAKGHAMMGIGRASGEDRARQATEKAIRSPLLDNLLLENAKGLIVNVVSSESVTLDELNQITEVVNDITDIEDANIFIGTVIDEKLGEDLHVTVIATGLTLDEDNDAHKPMPSANSTQTVDPATHTSAFNAHQRTTATQSHVNNPAGTSTPTSQPSSATKTNSIQDYLKRQQNR
ncbi:MAG TPA: cell division protein FtsZ [Psychrobacter sp.]|nr:cell division protein FtsZ [Psychrobacter sp.]